MDFIGNLSEKWSFWIDRGGTFTDLVAKGPDGKLVLHKLLSEKPGAYIDAMVQGIRDILGVRDGEEIPSNVIEHIKVGTTVATNALLERKGARVVFATTEGLGDVLRIGYQNRPCLFSRNIILPENLYEQVIEIEERIDVSGRVITPLNEELTRRQIQSAYDEGIRSIAIAFMHGYRYHDHEIMVSEIASEVGFSQISVSHKVSPLIKLVSRGDTTVLDGYLTPVIRSYMDQLFDELDVMSQDGMQVMFMQSNGGLVSSNLFQGKDAILSGPAGGVVGMVCTARVSGYNKLIGFDMGGTSTDVSHFNGEYERNLETKIAGVRVRVPMMNIHTVAAGGGSILKFDGSRYRVGPTSAGADPGPACYRKGGPLTVTDCNVMLGKIQPSYFPKIFGDSADLPLDREVVVRRFAEISDRVLNSRGFRPSSEDVAEGFIRIAIENMANAIKKISVQRGYDVTEYTINCFGGAGGQHACLVADSLGVSRIFFHPFAGVLSAFGMGLADIRTIREKQIGSELKKTLNMDEYFDSLIFDAITEIERQGISREGVTIIRKVYIRYQGTDSSLCVDYGDKFSMIRDFEREHRSRFGFIVSERGLVVEAISVEAVGLSERLLEDEIEVQGSKGGLEAIDMVKLYSGGRWRDVPLYDRDNMRPQDRVYGRAIIVERAGTIVVEDGWRAELNSMGHLILERFEERSNREIVGSDVDPVMLEVFNNLFMSVAEQMGTTLSNTSYSVNIKERLDFSCAIFDSKGDLVANAPHVPVHLGSMSQTVKSVLRDNRDSLSSGQVYMVNNPYNGGTHLPDVTLVSPLFDERGDLIFSVGSRGHHADIGGRTPGSAPPDSKHINEEGVLIDNFLLVGENGLRKKEMQELLSSGEYPCRNVDQNTQDILAQIAANETGIRELNKMIGHFGLEVVRAYMGHVQDNAEESIRRVIGVLRDGSFVYDMDNGSKICVSIGVDHDNRRARIDFRGTSSQSEGNYNAPVAICRAVVLYVFRTLVDDEIPLNEGCLKPLEIIIPENSMISPNYPAAVIAGNTEVSQSITDALYGALGIMASSQGTMNNFVYGNEEYQNYETICGGTGAGIDHDGCSAVHSHMTNTLMADHEVLESRYPIVVEEFSVRSGSGGEGRFSGGDGVVRKVRFLEPMTVTILSSHRETEPYGLEGGGAGKKGINRVIRSNGEVEILKGNDETEMGEGDVFEIETPGGGGFGAKI